MSDISQEGSPRFPPKVEAALRRGGWLPGRQVAEEEMEKWYVLRWQDAPGYRRIFPAAYRFLREFGGIRLVDEAEDHLIDPLEIPDYDEDKWIAYEWALETRLYPLTEWNWGGVLHIDIQGRFWSLAGASWEPFLEGHTTEEALTNIFDSGHLWSHPPQPVAWTPSEQLPWELIKRITKAEQNVVFPKAIVRRVSKD